MIDINLTHAMLFLSRHDPRTNSAAELFATAQKVAKEEFWKHGKILPTFLFDNEPGGYTSAVQLPWRDNKEKHAVSYAIKKTLEAFGADRYAVITEAWYYSQNAKSADSAWDSFRNNPPPSEHPDRKECVTIFVYDRSTPPLSCLLPIIRRPNSRPKLGDPEHADGGDGLIDMTFGALYAKKQS